MYLNKGERVYINELNQCVRIREAIKNVDGGYIYYIEPCVVDADNTFESFRKAAADIIEELHKENEKISKELQVQKEKVERQIRSTNAVHERLAEREKAYKDYKETHPYKHRWFNFRR